MLHDIRDIDFLFGCIPALLDGNFALILLLDSSENKAAIVNTCILNSFSWQQFTLLTSTRFMRVQYGEKYQLFST
jgi:hypothetical protein